MYYIILIVSIVLIFYNIRGWIFIWQIENKPSTIYQIIRFIVGVILLICFCFSLYKLLNIVGLVIIGILVVFFCFICIHGTG